MKKVLTFSNQCAIIKTIQERKKEVIKMLKFYSVMYKTYNNGTFIDGNYTTILAEEGDIENKTVFVNWDNLSEFYHEYNLMLPFNIWNFKRGRRVSFFNGNPFKKNFRDVKEWKTPLDIKIVIDYKDISNCMSIQEVLKWQDIDKAIQYLNEHGLKIN